MSLIAYRENTMRGSSMELVQKANTVIREYEAAGWSMTLRQLYYQLVSRDIIPNSDKEYKKLGDLISNARYYGLVSWRSITDQTRTMYGYNTVPNPQRHIEKASDSYYENLWKGQKNRIEVWVEKDALRQVIARPAGRNRCDYLACKGYMSSSEMFDAAQRFMRYERSDQHPVILHLGDHDPSGLHMTADIRERLREFCRYHGYPTPTVERVALNIDQIEQYNPPPNPAKTWDARFQGYFEETGLRDSWELDALSPDVIDGIIQEAIDKYVDNDLFTEMAAKEARNRALFKVLAKDHIFDDVREYLAENYRDDMIEEGAVEDDNSDELEEAEDDD